MTFFLLKFYVPRKDDDDTFSETIYIPRVFIVAMESINDGELITCNYGREYGRINGSVHCINCDQEENNFPDVIQLKLAKVVQLESQINSIYKDHPKVKVAIATRNGNESRKLKNQVTILKDNLR